MSYTVDLVVTTALDLSTNAIGSAIILEVQGTGPPGPQGIQGIQGPPGSVGKFPATGEHLIGDGTSKSFTVTHNLNTFAVGVELYDITAGRATVYADVKRPTVNTIVIDGFATAPILGAIGVVIWA